MTRFDEVARVAVVADPVRLSGPPQRLLDALSQSTLPGFAVDLVGPGGHIGPRHDLIHLLGGTSPAGALAVAREHDIRLVASYPEVPRDLSPSQCRTILSPGDAADRELMLAGACPQQLARWQPGVDPESFGPGHYASEVLPRRDEEIHVLHIGPPSQPALLAQALASARALEPRLTLHVVEDEQDLPRLYASADLLAHVSVTADCPLEIIEAQASGLAVLALDAGAAREVIEDGRDGVLVPPTPQALAEALVSLARRATLRERLTVGGLSAARNHTWQRSLEQLTAAWTAALLPLSTPLSRAA